MPRRPTMPTRPRRAAVAATAVPLAALLALGALKMAAPAEGQAGPSAAATPNARTLGLPSRNNAPADKQAVIDAEERVYQEASKRQPLPKGRATPLPVSAESDRRRTEGRAAGAGTLYPVGGSYPVRTADKYENRWVEEKGEATVGVWAGAEAGDPEQGIVSMVVLSPAGLGRQSFRTPGRAGSVRITGVSSERLELTAKNGTHFTFDVTTHTFVR